MKHRPRKRFGQHFLNDRHTVNRMLDAMRPATSDHFIEIGPGRGALTYLLAPRIKRLDAVELDRDLAGALQQRDVDSLYVHQADALKFDFGELTHAGDVRLVGNLPYNISTPLLFHLFAFTSLIRDMHFMLQKEVVERMAACPGNKVYGRLSVMAQYHCRLEHLFDVAPGAFTPPPKVQSSVVRALPHRAPPVDVADESVFAAIVTAAFGQRRKTLRNALMRLMSEDLIKAAGVDPKVRAETLSLAEFAALSRIACKPARNSI